MNCNIKYVVEYLERWPSGLRRTLGKCVYPHRYRGFESHSLRQIFSQKLGFFAQKNKIEIKTKKLSNIC